LTVSQQNTLSFNQVCTLSCDLSGYASPGILLWEYPIKKNFAFHVTTIGINDTFTLNPVTESKGPDLIVENVVMPSAQSLGDENAIKVDVKNDGDMKASLGNVTLNVENSSILYKPNEIVPGNTSEIIIKTPQTENLELTLNYKSDKLGCLPSKDFTKVINLDTLSETGPGAGKITRACTANSDCDSGFTCCQKECHDSSTGVCRDINGDGILDWVSYS
jgi:hypothetical protein